MAALNFTTKLVLGPEAMESLQDTLQFYVNPAQENVEPPQDMLQAMEGLRLRESSEESDVEMTDVDYAHEEVLEVDMMDIDYAHEEVLEETKEESEEQDKEDAPIKEEVKEEPVSTDSGEDDPEIKEEPDSSESGEDHLVAPGQIRRRRNAISGPVPKHSEQPVE